MVFNPARAIPKKQHTSKKSAQQEAVRLAQQHPGESFIVLEGLEEFKTAQPQIEMNYLEVAPEPANG